MVSKTRPTYAIQISLALRFAVGAASAGTLDGGDVFLLRRCQPFEGGLIAEPGRNGALPDGQAVAVVVWRVSKTRLRRAEPRRNTLRAEVRSRPGGAR